MGHTLTFDEYLGANVVNVWKKYLVTTLLWPELTIAIKRLSKGINTVVHHHCDPVVFTAAGAGNEVFVMSSSWLE